MSEWRKQITRSLYLRWKFEAQQNGDRATVKHYAAKLAEMDEAERTAAASPVVAKFEYVHPSTDEQRRQIENWTDRGLRPCDMIRWTGLTKGQVLGIVGRYRKRQRESLREMAA